MWVKRLLFGQRFAFIIIGLALLAGLCTLVAFTRWSPLTDDPDMIVAVLIVDLVIVLGLAAVIVIRILPLLRSGRGVAGSKLHRRLALFSALLAAAPTLFFAALGSVYFYMGVQSWFNDKVQQAIHGSESVAQAYLEEHQYGIRADALAMASDLTRFLSTHNSFGNDLQEFFRTQTYLRNLSEAVLRDEKGRTIAQSGLAYSLSFEDISASAMEEARGGDPVLYIPENEDRIRALVSLNTVQPLYLYVGRMVDEAVLDRVQETRAAAREYNNLRKQAGRVQKYSILMFAATGLLLVLTAVWFGLWLARRLMTPLAAMMSAAERVGAGDYNARVSEFGGFDEFNTMAKTFNTMTRQISDNINVIEMAEKKAAWGEVARRVAHEIKNPLTPIQLAAERLSRKYGKQITEDKQIFEESIQTIIKHVEDLKTMVNEFSQLADSDVRAVQKEIFDVAGMINSLIVLQKEAYPDIQFTIDGMEKKLLILSDETRLRQAVLNLVTNARNALIENSISEPSIVVVLEKSDNKISITVVDNGPGFPENIAERKKLLEPYVTTRKKGTGLGLAIVRKNIGDLGGDVVLSTADKVLAQRGFTGAQVTLVLPADA